MQIRAFLSLAALGVALSAVFPALPADARGVSAANLKALTNSINRAKNLTYTATYTSVANGQTTTVTIAQAPPQSNFSTPTGSIINDGKSTYYCSTTGGKQSCLSVSGANPLLGVENLFSPQLALGAFAEAKQGLVARARGVKVSQSSATYAGQPSTCISVTTKAGSGKYCVTKQGLLSYSGTSKGSSFQMTKYSSSPAARLFVLPAGATTVTLPSGVSIP
jgi:hypothetical protein